MTTETESAVRATLAAQNITYSAQLAQKGAKDADGWEHDAWRVTFTALDSRTYSLEFKTGTGLRKPPKGPKPNPPFRPDTLAHANYKNSFIPVAPEPAGVLHSIIMDDPRGESFSDWCDNFGYDTDSRKALAIYLECQKQTDDARAFFGRDLIEQFDELLQDY